MNVLEGVAAGGAVRVGDATIDVGRPISGRVSLGVRAEALRPAADGPFQGEVQVVERLGHRSLVHFAFAGAVMVAECPGDAPVRAGDRAAFTADAFHLFDERGEALAPPG
jgi:multiple sugar transport system ATP-binding protein